MQGKVRSNLTKKGQARKPVLDRGGGVALDFRQQWL